MALLLAALAAAGCGLGPGADVGGVALTVTREFGSVPVLEKDVGEVKESATVMRVLEAEAEISTRYGGGFVQSIEGIEGEQRGGHSYDWFFYVNGVESPIGAAEFSLHGEERIWWDYRDWTAAERVPAVVGSWPAPLRGGYEGKAHPVVVECEGGGEACARDPEGPRSGRRVDLRRHPQGRDPGAGRALGTAAIRPGGGAARSRPGGKRGLRRILLRARRYAAAGPRPRRQAARGASAPTPAWSRRPAATKRRRSGWSPAARQRACGTRPNRSTRPICATITRSQPKADG